MDILCQICLEPWDRSCINKNRQKCKKCDGTGRIESELYVRSKNRRRHQNDYQLITQDAEWQEIGECPNYHEDDSNSCDGHRHCMDRVWYEPETCECGKEVLTSWYEATAVIGDGVILCLDCAKNDEVIDDEVCCDECYGPGEIDAETELGLPEDIDRFLSGDGCPSCDWGANAQSVCDHCRKPGRGVGAHWMRAEGPPNPPEHPIAGYWPEVLCGWFRTPHEETTEKLSLAAELLGEDLDGLAVAHKDIVSR